MGRIVLLVLACCFGSPPRGWARLEITITQTLMAPELSMPGYFFISESVSEALRTGNRNGRLAYDILYNIWENDITADDVLKMSMSFTARTHKLLADAIHGTGQVHNDARLLLVDTLDKIAQGGKITPNLARTARETVFELVNELSGEERKKLKKELKIESIFQTYYQGLKQGLLPPLPRSVIYTFSHLDSVFQKEAQQRHDNWYVPLKTTASKIHRDTLVDHVSLISAVILGNQAKFFLSGRDAMRRTLDEHDSYRVFDDIGSVRGIEPLSIFDVADKLKVSPKYVLRVTTDPSNSVNTGWGIFPLYFFLNDVVKPEYAEEQQTVQEIIHKLDGIPNDKWSHSSNYDEKIAKELQVRGFRVIIKDVTSIRASYFGTTVVDELLKDEDQLHPLSSETISRILLDRADIHVSGASLNKYLRERGVPTALERREKAIKNIIYDVDYETITDLVKHLREMGIAVSRRTVKKYLQ